MGTNLLNLSPSYRTSELALVPGYGYCGWPSCFDGACALFSAFRPIPSVTTCYSCNFRLSIGNPCGSLLWGSCFRTFRLFHLPMKRLSGYFRRPETLVSFENFVRLAPLSVFRLWLQLPEERCAFFLQAVGCTPETCVWVAFLRLPDFGIRF